MDIMKTEIEVRNATANNREEAQHSLHNCLNCDSYVSIFNNFKRKHGIAWLITRDGKFIKKGVFCSEKCYLEYQELMFIKNEVSQ